MARYGKIARRPGDIRAQLNTRLQDGADGAQILAWLMSTRPPRQVAPIRIKPRPVQFLQPIHPAGPPPQRRRRKLGAIQPSQPLATGCGSINPSQAWSSLVKVFQ
jgi:hypothetical protein